MTESVHEEFIKKPLGLDFIQMMNGLLCCCKKKWFKQYTGALDLVKTDLDKQLDVLNLVKKLRMHSLTLTAITDRHMR